MPDLTTIPQLTKAEWSQNLLDCFPPPWTSDTARMPGGGLYSLCWAMAKNFETLNAEVVYAFNAARIDTATDVALDNAAKDFYGDQLPRLPGETDADYRARIKAGFFIPYTTRQAFLIALTRLLGEPPRLISPWLPQDTSSYDYSYYDVDIPGMPGLYGAPGQSVPYQVAVIATLPPTHLQIFGVLTGYDMGAAYDYSSGSYNEAKASLFFGPNQVDALIKRIKAAGITVWRKYLSQSLISHLLSNIRTVAGGSFEFPSTVLPVAGPYWVIVSGNWNANYYRPQANASGYTAAGNTPAPSGGGTLYTTIVPFTVSNSGINYLPPAATQLTIPCPAGNQAARLAITPSWPTDIWIDSVSGGNIIVNFNVPAPPGGFCGHVFMGDSQSGLVPVPTGAFGLTFPTANVRAAPFVLPSWNTQVAVSMGGGIISATFNTAAPVGGFCHVGFFKG